MCATGDGSVLVMTKQLHQQNSCCSNVLRMPGVLTTVAATLTLFPALTPDHNTAKLYSNGIGVVYSS